MNLDRSTCPRCLPFHGWLPTLSPRRVQPPCAVAEVGSVDAALERALGAYPVHPSEAWSPGWDPEDISDSAANPNMWTDGSRDEDLDAIVGVAGAGAFVNSVPCVFDDRAWGQAQDLDLDGDAAHIFSMVPADCSARGILGLSLLCRLSCRCIWVSTTKMFATTSVGFLLAGLVRLSVSVLMVTFFAVLTIRFCIGLVGSVRGAGK